MKNLINGLLKSKNEKNNIKDKSKNYKYLVIIIIVFIISSIILIILFKLFNITARIKYSKNSFTKKKKKKIYITNYENERTRLN